MLYPFNQLRGEARPLNNALAESIRLNGLREPLAIDRKGVILGGHRRYRAIAYLRMENLQCWNSTAREWQPAEQRFLLVPVNQFDLDSAHIVPFP
jgi:hypothetical protein